MANREMEDARLAPKDEVTPLSPQPPMASPAPSPAPSTPRGAASPPVMLATMTPVSVVGLHKEFDDDEEDDEAKTSYEEALLQSQAVDVKLFQRGDDDDDIQLVDNGAPPTTTVSVVVQQPGTLLGQAYGQQAGTTVLVLSELIDDTPQVIGLRYRISLPPLGNVLPTLPRKTRVVQRRNTEQMPRRRSAYGDVPDHMATMDPYYPRGFQKCSFRREQPIPPLGSRPRAATVYLVRPDVNFGRNWVRFPLRQFRYQHSSFSGPHAPFLMSSLSPRLRGRGDVVARLLASHLGEPGSIPSEVAPGFSHTRIVPDDAAVRAFFSRFSRLLYLCIPALLRTRMISPSSAIKTSMLRAAHNATSKPSNL
ncbi:hypothetical protein PR048_026186 [Dryococelus australis]|uniref:Uncharacterized protein n=1 Tax=Dryococelus australis TaxID=614101 RepID=A0ABQ9GKM1_9NEOP|nr:hypothetical protein PR048_026186 [Dryococelus australis]